jgi:hypothetical protein
MRTLLTTLLAAVAGVAAMAAPAGPVTARPFTAAEDLGEFTIVMSPDRSAVDLGDSIDVQFTVTNSGTVDRSDLIVHLDVISPARDGSVDPEDWTATLNQPLGALAPGATTTIDWTIQPISAGTFLVYGVVLAPDGTGATPSNVLTVQVTDRRSLDPQGVLPVVIVVPLAVGLLLADRLRRQRA